MAFASNEFARGYRGMADLKRNRPAIAEEEPVTVREADDYKIMREFCDDPVGFVQAAIEE